jgi:hypothetical protein
LLEKRKEILAGIQGQFTYIGGKSVALEHAVIELPFVFWQYKNPLDPSIGCGHIPGANATVKELRAYLEVVNPVSGLGDLDLLTFMPYYFQAATQLGAPGSKLSHLSGLKQHPYHLGQYTPPGVPIHYSNEAMKDIDAWTRKEADKIMFVYGELDPWTAAAFPDTDGAKDFHRFFVPGGNHGSKLFALTPKDREKAIAVVARWLGKAIPAGRLDLEATLEDAEFEFRSKHHVR